MKVVGTIRNSVHDGLFIVMCDARAEFGGWDVHGEMLADEGSTQLKLGELLAYVEEAHGRGRHEVVESDDGTLWIRPPAEPGVVAMPHEQLESGARTKVVTVGHVDVPSGTLTLALAYPPLNMTVDGDHAGVTHAEGERLDVATSARRFSVVREFGEGSQVLVLRPTT